MTRPAQTDKRVRVPYKGLAFWMFEAPPGTTIRTVKWGGLFDRDTCDWVAQIRVMGADDARNANKLLFGTTKNTPCDQRPKGARANRVRTRNVADDGRYSVPRANRLVQRVLCQRKGGCPIGADAQAWMLTQFLEVELSDVEAPSELGFTGGNLFGRWVRDEGTVNFTAVDAGCPANDPHHSACGSGIQTVRVLGEGDVQLARVERGCRFSQRVACPNGAGDALVSAGDVPRQGRQSVWLEAIDAAGNSTRSGPSEILIDSVAPGATPVTADAGTNWRNTPTTTLRWSNADNAGDQVSPITDISYEVCPATAAPQRQPCGKTKTYHVGDQPATEGAESLTIDAPPGESEVSMWRTDQAGNVSESNASVPVLLRYDPAAPKIEFKGRSDTDPTRLSAAVTDQYSGINTTSMEINGQGTEGAWKPLPTTFDGAELAGNVDDARLAAGTYSVRATATDVAGNTTIAVPHDAAGAEVKLTLPLRIEARMSAGVVTKRTHRRVVRRHGKRRVVRRQVTTYESAARAGFGDHVTLGGELTNRDGNPIGGASILVYSSFVTAPAQAPQLVGTVTTGPDGRYRYTTLANGNRKIAFVYAGTQQILPKGAAADLRVPASTSFTVDRRKVPNGGTIVFRGQVKSQPLPLLPSGVGSKNVDIQWKVSRKTPWKTFEDTTTDAAGRWRLPYRFSNIRSTVALRFRASLPTEGGYWFERGRSRAIRVVVFGVGR